MEPNLVKESRNSNKAVSPNNHNIMKAIFNVLIAQILAKFADLKGTSLVGIREYEAKTSGEVCNHVVNANFSYGNAVKKDLAKLNKWTVEDVKAIMLKSGQDWGTVEQAILDLSTSFKKNMNPETASAKSKAQKAAYVPITNAIKLNKESGLLHIYAMAVWKGEPIVNGVYKTVNSRPLTIAKKAVKKHFDFATAKYRNFIVHPDMLTGVAINGDVIGLE